MAQRIKLPSRDPGIRVELGPDGDHLVEFSLKPVTLEIEEQLADIRRENEEVEMNPDSRPIDMAEAELRQLDVILEPTAATMNAKAATVVPSEVLLGDAGDPNAESPRPSRPGYVTGDVTRAQIQSVVSRIVTAARPT